jgi:hypothetical protein
MENVYPFAAPDDAPNNGVNNFAALANRSPDCLAETDDIKGILVTQV